jgi:branched-chain amino acid transport system ATP-binding protein
MKPGLLRYAEQYTAKYNAPISAFGGHAFDAFQIVAQALWPARRAASTTLIIITIGVSAVLRGVSLYVDAGELVAVIGANGAGKTTLLQALSGLISARSGSVRMAGAELGRLSAEQRVGRGVALVPEHRQLFASMTVADNLLLGSYAHYWHTSGAELVADLEQVYTLFPLLRERSRQVAGTLSGGEQQMVAIGRGLMARPRLLLLDELSVGLAPLVVREIFAAIARLPAQGTTVLIVEQNARQILRLASRAYVLENGALTLAGRAAGLAADPAVQQIYMGHAAASDEPAG